MPGRRIPPELCARCKGYKKLCGLPSCPILSRFRAQVLASARLRGTSAEGDTPPSLLVGEEGYPRVPVILQVPPGVYGAEARRHDDPRGWAAKRVKLDEIIELRSRLLGGILRVQVTQPWVLYEREVSVASVSEKPVETSIDLVKRPSPRLSFDGLTAPRGPAAPAKSLVIEGNPSPPRSLEKLFFDDVRAEEAAWEAYRRGVDYYLIIRAFSAGLLGRLRQRRLVPTRWAITAVDSIISLRLRSLLATRPEVGQFEVYKGYYLGNRFLVILAPGGPSAHMVEVWHPFTPWVSGSKPVVIDVGERPSGAPTVMDGGFMAARLAAYEALTARGRRARVIIVREVLPEYYAPVGNWHIRETVKKALNTKPIVVTSDPLEAVRVVVCELEAMEARRRVEAWLKSILAQRRLDEWLGWGRP